MALIRRRQSPSQKLLELLLNMFFGVADFLLCLGRRSGQSYDGVERCAMMFSFRKHRKQVERLVLIVKAKIMYGVVSPGGESVVQWCGGEVGGGVVKVWYSVVSPGGEGGIICMIASTFVHCTTKLWQVCTKEKAKKVFGGEGGIIYMFSV